jgi:hypothetical protein
VDRALSKISISRELAKQYDKVLHLQYQTYITRTTIKYIFIMCELEIARINMFVFVRGQTLQSLSLTKKIRRASDAWTMTLE